MARILGVLLFASLTISTCAEFNLFELTSATAWLTRSGVEQADSIIDSADDVLGSNSQFEATMTQTAESEFKHLQPRFARFRKLFERLRPEPQALMMDMLNGALHVARGSMDQWEVEERLEEKVERMTRADRENLFNTFPSTRYYFEDEDAY